MAGLPALFARSASGVARCAPRIRLASPSGPTSFQPACQLQPFFICSADVEPGHALEVAGHRQAAGVDGVEADRLDEAEHGRLGLFVVAGHEAVDAQAAGHLGVGLPRGERRVERLHDARARRLGLDLLGARRAVGREARVVGLDRVGGVDDDLAVERRADLARGLRLSPCTARRGPRPPRSRRRRGWTRPPVRRSLLPAPGRSRRSAELTVTLCPALMADPVSALPTFPAPMIAMFMVVLRSNCFCNSSIRDYFI